MRLLTNFPLEQFGAREDYPFAEIVSYGPACGRRVGAEIFPYDVAFDAESESIEDLFARLPQGFEPDAIMLWWPDQDPIPVGLERCPVPSIAVMSDYNLTMPHLRRVWPFFDLVLCDRPSLTVMGRLPFARVEPWCQFSFRPDVHREYGEERDIDLCFVGNLHPIVQRERFPWLERLARLEERYHVVVTSCEQGEPYGRLLARSKIVFNRSVRGEINLRAFEATAAGALLMQERENLEIRDFFVEDREVVLYSPDDLETKIVELLRDDERRTRIAHAGQRRVQEHRLPRLFDTLPELIAELDVRRRPAATNVDCLLGRAESMLAAGRYGGPTLAPLVTATQEQAQSALAFNQLAVGVWSAELGSGSDATIERLLGRAIESDRDYLPARLNLATLYRHAGLDDLAHRQRDEILARVEEATWEQLDGLLHPLGFNSHSLTQASALVQSIRRLDPSPLRAWFAAHAASDELGLSPAFVRASDRLGFAALRSPQGEAPTQTYSLSNSRRRSKVKSPVS